VALGKLDPHTGVHTTGHEWAGITELDNPIPRVVKLSYAVTFAIAVILWVLYPTWPSFTTYSQGVLSWSQQETLETQLTAAANESAPWTDRIAEKDLAAIAADKSLRAFALQRGAQLFGDNCSVCHGQAGRGRPTFPNLADKRWLWGGKLADIHETLRVGINATYEDTRTAEMPAFGRDQLLERGAINGLVTYILQLAGLDPTNVSPKDRTLFADNCASCHGVSGRGNIEFGAPNLTDKQWIYGNSRAAIYATIFNGKRRHMPHWGDRMSPEQLKILTVYVASLSE